jgi:hypothetical protein
VAAVVAFISAVALFALGMMLGSVASGNGAPTSLVQLAGTVGELGALAVLVYAFTKIGAGPWAHVGRGLTVLGVALLMVGDTAASAAARDLGNVVIYVTFILLAILMWQAHVKLAAFAAITGVVGLFFAAVLEPMGVPPLSLLLIVAWFVAVGADWLRAPWPVIADAEGLQPAHG